MNNIGYKNLAMANKSMPCDKQSIATATPTGIILSLLHLQTKCGSQSLITSLLEIINRLPHNECPRSSNIRFWNNNSINNDQNVKW